MEKLLPKRQALSRLNKMCRVLVQKNSGMQIHSYASNLKCQIIISHLSVNSRRAIRCRVFHDADFTNVVAFRLLARRASRRPGTPLEQKMDAFGRPNSGGKGKLFSIISLSILIYRNEIASILIIIMHLTI